MIKMYNKNSGAEFIARSIQVGSPDKWFIRQPQMLWILYDNNHRKVSRIKTSLR